MVDALQLRTFIVEPTLRYLGLDSLVAVNLVLGTCAQESQMGTYIDQITPGPGPAYGIYQMERATHDDIKVWVANRHPRLSGSLLGLEITGTVGVDAAAEMAGNLYYATAMCRLHYYRVPEPIPETLVGQARYWKMYYNSILGKGTEEQFINNYRRYVR